VGGVTEAERLRRREKERARSAGEFLGKRWARERHGKSETNESSERGEERGVSRQGGTPRESQRREDYSAHSGGASENGRGGQRQNVKVGGGCRGMGNMLPSGVQDAFAAAVERKRKKEMGSVCRSPTSHMSASQAPHSQRGAFGGAQGHVPPHTNTHTNTHIHPHGGGYRNSGRGAEKCADQWATPPNNGHGDSAQARVNRWQDTDAITSRDMEYDAGTKSQKSVA